MAESQSPARQRTRIGLAEIVGDGVFAGLIGASGVALWFLIVDTAFREAFFTPSLVGSALLRGTPVAPDHAVDLTMVAAYTALHSLAFIVYGVVASWVVDQFERTPDLPLIVIGLFVVLQVGFVAALRLLVPDVAAVIGYGFMAAGNAFAAIGMGLYLHDWQRHPEDVAAATPR